MASSPFPTNITASAFYVDRASGKLAIKIPSPTVIFFKMSTDEICKKFEPVYVQLAAQEHSIKFGIVNLLNEPTVTSMSRSTSTPIKVVPTLIFFFNGRASSVFNGSRNIPSISSWLKNQMHLLSQSSMQSREFVGSRPPPAHIPPSQPPQQYGDYPQRGFQQQPPPSQQLRSFGSQQSTGRIQQQGQQDDDVRMKLPDDVTPHNIPWEVMIKEYP